jgi:hypothetical protein
MADYKMRPNECCYFVAQDGTGRVRHILDVLEEWDRLRWFIVHQNMRRAHERLEGDQFLSFNVVSKFVVESRVTSVSWLRCSPEQIFHA